MKVSELVGKEATIDQALRDDFYYEFEHGGRFDYAHLDKHNWTGTIVDVGVGRAINVVVVVEGKYFELESGEALVDGETVDDIVSEWDWDNVKGDYPYSDECGMLEDLED